MIETEIVTDFIMANIAMDSTIETLLGGSNLVFDQGGRLPVNGPCIVFQPQAPLMDTNGQAGVRIMSIGLYIVRAIVPGSSFIPARPIANRIDTLLQLARGSTIDGDVYAMVREEPYRMAEDLNGQSFRHLGGVYRVFVRSN